MKEEKNEYPKQKIENSLNLALDSTEEELEKATNLNVGYDKELEKWEVIIKYSGKDIESIIEEIVPNQYKDESKTFEEYSIVKLLNEYVILVTSKSIIERLAALPQIEFIEKPKRLFFERLVGVSVSGIVAVKNEPYDLQGSGIIVGILDSGIDYLNTDFRNSDGTTRILLLWDQTIEGNAPKGYNSGTEYTKEEINEAIRQRSIDKVGILNSMVPSVDITRHGTEVASIAVGNGGVASKADIIVVKLGNSKKNGFQRTTELMQGLDYLVKKSLEYKKPLSINISIGNTYGAHDGSSLMERFIDDVSNYWKVCICVGAGNEGNASGHIGGKIKAFQIETIEIAVNRREISFDLQIWKFYEDEVEISLIAPNGTRVGPIQRRIGTQRYLVGSTEILLYYGEPNPYTVLQEIYFEFIPRDEYIDTGIWSVELTPISIVTGEYNMWLPSYGVLNVGTQFLSPTKENTITIPSTAQRVISVGAYDAKAFTYADFSGRGRENNPRNIKPDLVAPGVDISVTSVGENQGEVSGTSFATPFVTGSVALLMEWGIVKENDVYLYGEKMKAMLRSGATPLIGVEKYPNIKTGYGKLDLDNTIRKLR